MEYYLKYNGGFKKPNIISPSNIGQMVKKKLVSMILKPQQMRGNEYYVEMGANLVSTVPPVLGMKIKWCFEWLESVSEAELFMVANKSAPTENNIPTKLIKDSFMHWGFNFFL